MELFGIGLICMEEPALPHSPAPGSWKLNGHSVCGRWLGIAS